MFEPPTGRFEEPANEVLSSLDEVHAMLKEDQPTSESPESDKEKEVKEILNGLEILAQQETQMAVRRLCAKSSTGSSPHEIGGVEFIILGEPSKPLESRQWQISYGTSGYNFGSWMKNLPELAEQLQKNGMTSGELFDAIEVARESSSDDEEEETIE